MRLAPLFLLILWLAPFFGWAQEMNVIDCSIIDQKGEVVQKWPGFRCVFMDDGSVILGTLRYLRRLDSTGRIIWQRDIETHHQLNLSEDKKSLLVMSSSFGRRDKETVRYDRLEVRNLDGDLLHSFDFQSHWSNLLRRKNRVSDVLWEVQPFLANPLRKPKMEATHANSFYRIGKQNHSGKNTAFTEGNYVAHDRGLILILSRDLKEILWSRYFPTHSMHDVQVTEFGKILAYVNYREGDRIRHSYIAEIDPESGHENVLFRRKPWSDFYGQTVGGVQILESGNILTSHLKGGGTAMEVTPKGETVWQITNPDLDGKTGRPALFQQIKRFDLTKYLEANPGIL